MATKARGRNIVRARLERFLQLCANDNMQVCNITTPANYFHVLRRQMLRPFRKPLVIMTPKSLLRHPMAKSPASEFTGDMAFMRIMSDTTDIADEKVRRLVLCSGKVAYDLHREARRGRAGRCLDRADRAALSLPRRSAGRPDRADDAIWKTSSGVRKSRRTTAHGSSSNAQIEEALTQAGRDGMRPVYAGREAAASPATGFAKRHEEQQGALVSMALGLCRMQRQERTPAPARNPPSRQHQSLRNAQTWPPKSQSRHWANRLPKAPSANG